MTSFDSTKALHAAQRDDAAQHMDEDTPSGGIARAQAAREAWHAYLAGELARTPDRNAALWNGTVFIAHLCGEMLLNLSAGNPGAIQGKGEMFFSHLVDQTYDMLKQMQPMLFDAGEDQ